MTVLLNSRVVCPSCGDHVFVDDRGRCPWCDTALTAVAVPKRARNGNAGIPIMMSVGQIEEAYRWYADHGLSIRGCAARLLPDTGYSSVKSCAISLHDQWRRRGWPLRDRIVATVTSSWKHGDNRRGARNPERRRLQRLASGEQRGVQCEGVKLNSPGKGRRCRRAALAGDVYCIAHSPARAQRREENLIRARARIQPSAGSAESE